jgi:hypothetical protein
MSASRAGDGEVLGATLDTLAAMRADIQDELAFVRASWFVGVATTTQAQQHQQAHQRAQQQEEAQHHELAGLRQSALRKRCVEAGMDVGTLEACDDADDTKAEFLEWLARRPLPASYQPVSGLPFASAATLGRQLAQLAVEAAANVEAERVSGGAIIVLPLPPPRGHPPDMWDNRYSPRSSSGRLMRRRRPVCSCAGAPSGL